MNNKIQRSNYIPYYEYQYDQNIDYWYDHYKEHVDNMFNIYITEMEKHVKIPNYKTLYKKFIYMIFNTSYKYIN